ncbi:hypothetical protein [Mycobacterium marinum]|uniref:hypothetical protein n=1 Tax=Mycobacterium marinum TaxID=1781 RepID=UPI00045FD03A|nr:hypothetical protein [Mycobacterium marinum]CDM76131.1 hypothetical protein MMARE11_19840 [Mycobacterium marinum E11]
MTSIDFSAAKSRIMSIQQRLDAAVEQVRSNKSLTEAGRKREIAIATMKAKREAHKAKEEFVATRELERQTLRRLAFGSSVSEKTAGIDRVSMRDALDRAGALDTEQSAKDLFERAVLHNDDDLAKAVASRAHERKWNDVVTSYGKTFGRQRFIDQLDEIPSGPNTDAATNVAFRLQNPRELRGNTAEHQIQQLATAEVQ